MHINELLTYIIHYRNNSTINNIKKVIINFYNCEEILLAKKLLWELCKDRLDLIIVRKSTEQRSSSEANLSDIVDALQKLDNEEAVIPNFVAVNLDRLPDKKPEELNIISVGNKISQLEDKSVNCDNVLSEHTIDLSYLKSLDIEAKIKKIEDQITRLSESPNCKEQESIDNNDGKLNNKTAMIKDKGKNNEISDDEWLTTDEDESNGNYKNNHRNSISDKNIKMMKLINKVYGKSKKIPRKLKVKTTDLKPKGIENGTSTLTTDDELSFPTDDEGFTEYISKNKRKRLISRANKDNLIKGAPLPNRHIFVGRFISGDENSIKKYLYASSVKFESIERISDKYARFNSFKITVPINFLNQILDEKFWPEGIIARIWKDKNGQHDKNDSDRVHPNSSGINSSHFYNSQYRNKI